MLQDQDALNFAAFPTKMRQEVEATLNMRPHYSAKSSTSPPTTGLLKAALNETHQEAIHEKILQGKSRRKMTVGKEKAIDIEVKMYTKLKKSNRKH